MSEETKPTTTKGAAAQSSETTQSAEARPTPANPTVENIATAGVGETSECRSGVFNQDPDTTVIAITDEPQVHFLGPKPPIPAAALEFVCAVIYDRMRKKGENCKFLCLYVQEHASHTQHLPSVSGQECFTLGAVPCSNPWEMMVMLSALSYSHSYPHSKLLERLSATSGPHQEEARAEGAQASAHVRTHASALGEGPLPPIPSGSTHTTTKPRK